MLHFSLSAIVLVELSLACNIQIGENERGRCLSDFSTIHALLFSIFRRMVCRIRKLFLALNNLHSKGNHPSKFQLIRFNRFRGVKKTIKQTQTDRQTH